MNNNTTLHDAFPLTSTEALGSELLAVIALAVQNVFALSLRLVKSRKQASKQATRICVSCYHGRAVEKLVAHRALEAKLVVLLVTRTKLLLCSIDRLGTHCALGRTTTDPEKLSRERENLNGKGNSLRRHST
jgi:hypothetical protein